MINMYDLSDLEMLARDCLTRAGVAEAVAAIVAHDVALAEAAGQSESGFEALLRDIRLIRYGRLHPDAVVAVHRPAPTVLRVDAGHGFAAAAVSEALPDLAQTAKSEGMAMIHLTRASDPGSMAAALVALAGQGLAAVVAAPVGQAHAIRAGATQSVPVSGGTSGMLTALLSLAPPVTDSPLDGLVSQSAWIAAFDPAATAAEEMLAHLPDTAPAVRGGIPLAPDLLAQIVNA